MIFGSIKLAVFKSFVFVVFEYSVCDESAWFSESDEFLIFVKFIVLLDKEVLWESRGLCIRLGLVVLYKLPDINGLSISYPYK